MAFNNIAPWWLLCIEELEREYKASKKTISDCRLEIRTNPVYPDHLKDTLIRTFGKNKDADQA